jgi:hypothetical protein
MYNPPSLKDLGCERLVVDCDCSSIEHMAVIDFWSIDFDEVEIKGQDIRHEYPEMYLHLQIRPHGSIWKRIYVAVRYLFGKDTDSAYWADTMISENQAIQIRDLMQRMIDNVAEQRVRVNRLHG